MGPTSIIVETPRFDDPARHRQAAEDMFVEAFVPEASVEAFDEGVLDRFARRDVVPSDTALFCQRKMACEVSSVPLSLTTLSGFLRAATIASSSRATRRPESDVSTTSARHSRVKSSTTTNTGSGGRRPARR